MIKDDSIYLEHILQSLLKIIEYTNELTVEDFLKNSLVQDGVIRQFEIIGEASKRISLKLKQENNDIPWQDITGMRNKLIHDYLDVDTLIIWETVKEDVPFFLEKIKRILKKKFDSP